MFCPAFCVIPRVILSPSERAKNQSLDHEGAGSRRRTISRRAD